MKIPDGGLIILDKQAGLTSAGLVAGLRPLLGMKRVGHTGTLDPFATGVLPICFGRATAAAGYMQKMDKAYLCEIKLGYATTSMDREGEISERAPDEASYRRFLEDASSRASLESTVASLTRETSQKAPLYSAVKVGGKRLYKYARQGEEVEPPDRPITVHEASLVGLREDEDGYPLVAVEFLVSSGTYIRSLADLLGRRLASFGHAASLRRLSVGPFGLEQAVSLDRLGRLFREEGEKPGSFRDRIQAEGLVFPVGEVFRGWNKKELSREEAVSLAQGQTVACGPEVVAELAFFHKERLIAIGGAADGICRVTRVFTDPGTI